MTTENSIFCLYNKHMHKTFWAFLAARRRVNVALVRLFAQIHQSFKQMILEIPRAQAYSTL